MEVDDQGIDLRSICNGSTLLQWEAFIEAFIAFNNGRLPFGLGIMNNFDTRTCLRRMKDYGLLKECEKHPGYYILCHELSVYVDQPAKGRPTARS